MYKTVDQIKVGVALFDVHDGCPREACSYERIEIDYQHAGHLISDSGYDYSHYTNKIAIVVEVEKFKYPNHIVVICAAQWDGTTGYLIRLEFNK